MMAKAEKRVKKRNFTQCEVEVLVSEVDTGKTVLFGGLGVGIANAKKAEEWQHVADAVNNVASEGRTVTDIKKKWSDIKVEARKRIALHSKRVCDGWGKGDTGAHPHGRKVGGDNRGIPPEWSGDGGGGDRCARITKCARRTDNFILLFGIIIK